MSNEDQELLLDKEIRGNEGFDTAMTEEPGEGGLTAGEAYNKPLHSPEPRARHPLGQDCQVAHF